MSLTKFHAIDCTNPTGSFYKFFPFQFMVRYKMPLQQKFSPGNRNLASSTYCFKGKGWYSYLTRKEQKLLNDGQTILSSELIPDNLLHGICRSESENLSQSSCLDIQNTSIFRDGSVNSMELQNKIRMLRYLHSSQRENPNF